MEAVFPHMPLHCFPLLQGRCKELLPSHLHPTSMGYGAGSFPYLVKEKQESPQAPFPWPRHPAEITEVVLLNPAATVASWGAATMGVSKIHN